MLGRHRWAGGFVAVSLLVVVGAAALSGAAGADRGSARSAVPAPNPLSGASPAQDHGNADPTQTLADGHGRDEGLTLVAAADGPVTTGPDSCTEDQPVAAFDVTAIDVDIHVNRYLDHDPLGLMFVLTDDVDAVRAEEAANAAARAGTGDPAVSLGLQGDAIQPLVIRARPGDCVRVTLRNELSPDDTGAVGAVSMDLHGAAWRLASGRPAVISDDASYARGGESVDYVWSIAVDQPEGTHYFHSTGDERDQTSHGLFGALVVEPPGSVWTDPRTGEPLRSGWDAIVARPDGSSFREFALLYHEIGDESYQLQDAAGGYLPLVDDTTDAYRPASRALNYRSEPFRNRLVLGDQTTGVLDRSLAYSSYSFGDPATPILRTEVGDPTVQRIVHAGSEVHHVHHVHGGSIRWPRQPGTQDSSPIEGLEKHPPLTPAASERTDSQSIGPAETFDVFDECTAGGCQQSPGDVMYHCHIAHHYVAGMWGIWRVYNTQQSPGAQTDDLPSLRSLPDREDALAPAVPSDRLVGTTVSGTGDEVALTSSTLENWVGRLLPPQGRPKGYDASVWDWIWEGTTARGEPESADAWPGHRSDAPGERPPILFDPRTGKPAFPFLRPHLARRPPFARDHSPEPYLDPPDAGPSSPEPRPPGASASSVCPAGTTLRPFAIEAIRTPVAQNASLPIVDPRGLLFVLREERDAVRADPSRAGPLVIRANATEDCVDVVFRSAIPDDADEPFAKNSLHIHHVQFDIQGSDGVANGFNYEQSIRPYTTTSLGLALDVVAGTTTLPVPGAGERFSPGTTLGIGLDEDETFEQARVLTVDADGVTLTAPLVHDHPAGALVGTEYLRHRWYPDVQFGTAYFHDHVDAIHGWRHGLVGALVAEPPGSRYSDPFTGEVVASGPVADITTDGMMSVDVDGSFREFVVLVQDDNPLSRNGRSSGSALGLRVEPLDRRDGDPAEVFSSVAHGDPATGVLDAILGDPLVFRALVSGSNDVHTLHIDGHWFRVESWSAGSKPVDTVRVGVSERFDLVVPSAGGPRHQPGEYLVRNGRIEKFEEGSWTVLRVHEGGSPDAPLPLDGREIPRRPDVLCPADAPRVRLLVDAVTVELPMLGRRPGAIYVDRSRADRVLAGDLPPEPWVAHVSVGDCIEIELRNRTEDGPVSLHANQLAYDPSTSGGVAIGDEPVQAAAPGTTVTFTFYASPEVGETVALVHDYADVTRNPSRGLYGAIVVGAAGTRWEGEGPMVVAVPRDGPAYRDATLFLHDEDAGIGTHRMPYSTELGEVRGINYVTAEGPPGPGVDSPAPTISARRGDPLRVHVVVPVSEQVGVFEIEGHPWPVEPGMDGSTRVAATSIGALEALSLEVAAGEAGPGSYVYGMVRGAYRDAGMWGTLVVDDDVAPLPAPDGRATWPFVAAGIVVLAVAGAAAFRWRSAHVIPARG